MDDAIHESLESDNTVAAVLIVEAWTNLAVVPGSLDMPPGELLIGDTVTVRATVANLLPGKRGPGSDKVGLWNGKLSRAMTPGAPAGQMRGTIDSLPVGLCDGTPGQPGTVRLADSVIPVLAMGQEIQVAFSWADIGPVGPHRLCVWVDPQRRQRQTNLDDDVACGDIEVRSGRDLFLGPGDLTVSPDTPAEGGSLRVVVRVRNVTARRRSGDALDRSVAAGAEVETRVSPKAARSAADSVRVRFYLGVPGSGGVAQMPDLILPDVPADSFAIGEYWWRPIQIGGAQQFAAWVDPDSLIRETNRDNNRATVPFFVLPGTTAPAPPDSFAVTQFGPHIRLYWRVPTTLDYRGVMFRYALDASPLSPTEGTELGLTQPLLATRCWFSRFRA